MDSNFNKVAHMNEAFHNKRGDVRDLQLYQDEASGPDVGVEYNVNVWSKVRKQSLSIFDETFELMAALGVPLGNIEVAKAAVKAAMVFADIPNLPLVRDSLCDIHVFAYGAHHLMGIDADRDMHSVLNGVMTRFIKDDADKLATIKKHNLNVVYFEGEYPVMVMKSGIDQPDAPKGKFLKSASYAEPVFYDPIAEVETANVGEIHGKVVIGEDGYVKGISKFVQELPNRQQVLKPVKSLTTWSGVNLEMNEEARALLDRSTAMVNRETPTE